MLSIRFCLENNSISRMLVFTGYARPVKVIELHLLELRCVLLSLQRVCSRLHPLWRMFVSESDSMLCTIPYGDDQCTNPQIQMNSFSILVFKYLSNDFGERFVLHDKIFCSVHVLCTCTFLTSDFNTNDN